MYRVKTYLAPSSIDGIGVFAGENISKGAIVWEFVAGFDLCLSSADIKKLPEAARRHIAKHAFVWEGKFYLCGDHGQFTNHSDDPNTINAPGNPPHDIAARDIQTGEEITCDYRVFDELWKEKLLKE